MNNYDWSEAFIKAVQALVDALSYVDEFDKHTFMSTYFGSSENSIPQYDIDSQRAGKQAKEFLDTAHKLIQTLMSYHPQASGSSVPSSWWKNDEKYKLTVELLDMLQRSIIVIHELDTSIASMRGISFSTTRQGFITFKKQCLEAVDGINNQINLYNRYVKDVNYKLTSIQIL